VRLQGISHSVLLHSINQSINQKIFRVIQVIQISSGTAVGEVSLLVLYNVREKEREQIGFQSQAVRRQE